MEARRVWLITGCSGRFGLASAKVALDHGGRVIATARRCQNLPLELKSSKNVIIVDLYVTLELRDFGIKISSVALDSYNTGFMQSAHRTSTKICEFVVKFIVE